MIKLNNTHDLSYRLAIIDLGTNSVRLDIYRINKKKAIRVYRDKVMVRLGDGVFKSGKLSQASMKRTIDVFVGFKKHMINMRVNRIVAFGTSALRTASNSKDFLNLLKAKTGVQVRIISGAEEGRLIAQGIMENIDTPKGWYALVDIGGGSTEISICFKNKIKSCHSFKLGANRLQQMFFKTIPPVFKRGELHPVLALRQYLKTELISLSRFCEKREIALMIGSSGTIRSVGKILKENGGSHDKLLRSEISALASELQLMTRDEIKSIKGLEAKRVDLILPGAILLDEILIALKTSQVKVTELALRDGILHQEITF